MGGGGGDRPGRHLYKGGNFELLHQWGGGGGGGIYIWPRATGAKTKLRI